MKINKNLILVLLVSILVLVSGCSSGTDAKKSSFNLKDAFTGGSEGLKFEFMSDQPPKNILDGGISPFNIMVQVSNVGEFDIPVNSSHLVLSGINPIDFSITKTSQLVPQLNGVKIQKGNTLDGATLPVMFPGLTYLPNVSGSSTQKIGVDICYPYRTTSLINACVSGNTLRSSTDSLTICKLDGKKDFANSGAPIQIENVKQFPNGKSSIQVQFDIVDKSKSKNGRIFRVNSFDNNCKIAGNSVASTDAILSKNYVTYTFDAKGLPVVCQGKTKSGEVLLANGKSTVYCTIDTSGQQDYEQTFAVYLDYSYFDRIETSILVENVLR